MASLDPQSYLQGFIFLPFFRLFFLLSSKEEHEIRQISWEMSQRCLLLKGLGAFAARAMVSDTSCHFQCSLLVPESAPNIPPQEMLLHNQMKEGKNSKTNLKRNTRVRKQTNKKITPQWKFA